MGTLEVFTMTVEEDMMDVVDEEETKTAIDPIAIETTEIVSGNHIVATLLESVSANEIVKRPDSQTRQDRTRRRRRRFPVGLRESPPRTESCQHQSLPCPPVLPPS
jgi:hypothetical protein